MTPPLGAVNTASTQSVTKTIGTISVLQWMLQAIYWQTVLWDNSLFKVQIKYYEMLFTSSLDTGYPGFAHPLPSVTIPLGATAIFECPVLSNPPANVSWAYQDNSPIPSNSRFTISPANTLRVENVQLSDERFYVCHAVNTYGRNSSSARLTIGSKLHVIVEII